MRACMSALQNPVRSLTHANSDLSWADASPAAGAMPLQTPALAVRNRSAPPAVPINTCPMAMEAKRYHLKAGQHPLRCGPLTSTDSAHLQDTADLLQAEKLKVALTTKCLCRGIGLGGEGKGKEREREKDGEREGKREREGEMEREREGKMERLTFDVFDY